MKSKTLIVSALAVVIGASGAASSFAATANAPVKDPVQREKRVARMIQRLDTDGDNKVSKPEIEAAMARAFDIVDTNHDGSLSKAELESQRDTLKAYRQKVRAEKQADVKPVSAFPKAVVKHFDKIDANKDGVLSKREMTVVVDRIFQRRDKNQDGFITADDFQKKS